MKESFLQHWPPPGVIGSRDLARLFTLLHERGYEIVGPTLRSDAIVYEPISSVDDLPVGWMDVQAAGRYRLQPRDDDAHFGYTGGAQSWKRYLFPPEQRLWSATCSENGSNLQIETEDVQPARRAFMGVRACELAAIAIQDRIFMGGAFVDPAYKARRENVLVIAVDCGHATDSCFCTSMGTGPEVGDGFDLALTELISDRGHRFVVHCGSTKGEEVFHALEAQPASPEDMAEANEVVARTEASIRRRLDTSGLHNLLVNNPELAEWDRVAQQCLACANCTLVCPTCFCSTVEDTTDLGGGRSERVQKWDSCFSLDFSYIHGGPVRPSTHAQYRQWMTHKLATWIDQYDTMGCVGCGRCITWCPVGIDITEIAGRIRADVKRQQYAAEASTNRESGENG